MSGQKEWLLFQLPHANLEPHDMESESVALFVLIQIAQHDDAQFSSEHLELVLSAGCPVVVLQSKWVPDVSIPEYVRQVDPIALITFQSFTQCRVVLSSRDSRFPEAVSKLAPQSPSGSIFFRIELGSSDFSWWAQEITPIGVCESALMYWNNSQFKIVHVRILFLFDWNDDPLVRCVSFIHAFCLYLRIPDFGNMSGRVSLMDLEVALLMRYSKSFFVQGPFSST